MSWVRFPPENAAAAQFDGNGGKLEGWDTIHIGYSRRRLSELSTRKTLLAERGRERLHQPTGGRSRLTLSNMDRVVDPHDTRKALATELGVGTGTRETVESLPPR